MTNYVLAFKGGAMAATEQEQQDAIAAWSAWYAGLGEAVVDGGNPFGPAVSVSTDGAVSDGATSGLTGYAVLAADSLAAAASMAKGCPILAIGGSIEVHETIQVM